ncbi:MAG: hypothetical protein ACKV0T_19925 [Planctomycetales bacterium]
MFVINGMPHIFRAMLCDGDKPTVESTARGLGVRLPPDAKPDLLPDSKGLVLPNTGGMSVAPRWQDLPFYRIPRRLKHFVREASGANGLACWRFATIPFVNGPVALQLTLRIDGPRHGLIEPATPMQAGDFQTALGATQLLWFIDESYL